MPVTITKSSSIQKNTGIFNLQFFLFFFILHASKFGLRCSCFIHILSKKYFYPFQAPPTYLPVVHTYACPYICKVCSHKVNHIKSYCQNFHTLKLDTDRIRRRKKKKTEEEKIKFLPISVMQTSPPLLTDRNHKSGGNERRTDKKRWQRRPVLTTGACMR